MILWKLRPNRGIRPIYLLHFWNWGWFCAACIATMGGHHLAWAIYTALQGVPMFFFDQSYAISERLTRAMNRVFWP